MMVAFLTYYYTDIYVIPVAVVAWLLLVPRFFDAFCDPLFGYLVDRTGGRHVVRLMGVLAVPFGLSAFFCFLPLPLAPTAKIVWACGTYLVAGAVYSAINTPYGVLSNMMAVTAQERVSLNAFRLAGCQLGQLAIASILLPAISLLGGGAGLSAQRAGITSVAAIIGVAGVILWLITWRGCRVRRPLPAERHTLRTLLGVLITNRRWHLSNALTYLNFTVFCSESGLAIHYTRLVLRHPVSDAAFLLTCMNVGAFAGTILVPRLTQRLGIRNTYLALLAWQVAGLALMLVFSGNFVMFLAAMALHSLAVGPISPLCLAILSEAIDEGREKTGIAAAGLAFSYNTLISKIAAAVAGFAIATFLSWGHYAPTMAVPDATLAFWLKAGFLGLPFCSIALAALLMLASRRDERALPVTIAALPARG
jgi:GPH family glycoside/pentoside/hexuronide:cation symporter